MVPTDRQKFLGLVKGKVPGDEVKLGDLAFKGKPPYKFTLMGTPDSQLFVAPMEAITLPLWDLHRSVTGHLDWSVLVCDDR